MSEIQPKLYSAAQAGKILNITSKAVRRTIAAGGIKGIRLDRRGCWAI
jgi:hypothetical protein